MPENVMEALKRILRDGSPLQRVQAVKLIQDKLNG